MSKLVDEMILFFQKVRVLDSPGRIKENLVLRAAEIEGLKGFEEAADAELQFVNASKMLDRELKQLKIKFEKGDEQYCPELDRFLMYAKMVRAELAQVPRSLLDPDLKELLETKHQEAIKSQLELLDLKSQVRIVDVDMASQVAPMKPFHEVAAEFCRTNQKMKTHIQRTWVAFTPNGEALATASTKVIEPPDDIGDVEWVDPVYVSQSWFLEQSGKGNRSPDTTFTIDKVALATKARIARVQPVNPKYAKAVLETMLENTAVDALSQPTLQFSQAVLFTDPAVSLDPKFKAGALDNIKAKVNQEIKKSYRHALEAAEAVDFDITKKLNMDVQHWQNLFTKKGETYHLGLAVKQCLVPKPLDPPRQQSRGIFEVEVLVALRDKVNAEPKAEAAVNSSIEALTLFSEFANTVPDKAMMLKDPSTLLRVQGLDVSNVKQLSDKTGYRVLFPVLNSDETPDGVHLVAHQILNPYLLDIMHRSKEMQSALNNAWDVYKSHTKGRELVALALNRIVTAKKTFKFT